MPTAVCLKITRLGVSPATTLIMRGTWGHTWGHMVTRAPLPTIHFSPLSPFSIFLVHDFNRLPPHNQRLSSSVGRYQLLSLSSKRLPLDLSNLTMAHPLTVLFSTTLAYSKEKNPLTALLLPLNPPGVQRLHNAPPPVLPQRIQNRLSCLPPRSPCFPFFSFFFISFLSF